ncbi:DUF4335 domain-containing protein [Microcoleus sp. bin38.metabat.b11b12b14.051]|uniref:DUF4335 domain-containing protein n=1 Tax=Microcoleus sp. bin38.metabat.b11b12b14.051 TaxID=2742709 RepID=UPI0025F27A7B|nr:DUF4335 domain-containing protein [Microcoleus sp. bin38.metabat.b11b12b14.051]
MEITAKSSPLSRWAGKPVFKSLNFELRLDDPRLPDTQHVTLRGDRQQLETLHEAVSNYVQNFLGESREWESNIEPETSLTAGADLPEIERNAVTFDRPPNTSELATAAPNTTYLPVPPRLEPRGLLAHNLFLGSLSAVESGPEVHLSTLQLFDLATALDDCAAEVMALPNLNRDRSRAKALPWLNIAAMLVAGVGMTAGIVKMLDRPNNSPQTASAPAPAPANPQFTPVPGQPQILAGATPSPVPAPTTSPTTSPVPTPTATATPGLPPLPPPPINTASATPSPSLPPIALAPSPATNKPSPIQQPALLFPPNSSAPAASGSAPALPSGQIITIPDPVPAPPLTTAPQAPATTPYVLPPIPPRLAPAVPPPLPPSLSASRFPVPPPQPFPRRIEPIVPPASTELPALEDAQPQAESPDSNQAAASKKNRTLFDTIPQVSEARTYFEERWKPPEGMEQTLEYSVQIDENGSIQTIVPMGKAAADYIDRTNMPLVGEPFVSAVSRGKNPKIRVVLRPNGRVQTFLEESN